jgi:transposase InsO family protein
MVHRLPHIDHIHQRCADYIDTKMKRSPFLSQVKRRAEGLLDLIHGDLCGPITPATPDGKKYYLLLVDDKSRLMWVALLATKSDALAVLKKFHAKVCVLRTNNGGGGFTSIKFENYCTEHGVERQHTAPYMPQQNIVVEWRNQSVVAMA